MHMTGNFIGRALAVLALALLLPAQGWAADPDPRLEGRTLDVLVGFSNTGDGARFWNLFSGALRRHLPKTVIRARFDDTARGAKGTSDLFSLPEGSLAVGFVRPPDVAFAQARKLEGVDYDLHQAKWIAGVEKESFVMVARRGLPVEPQALRATGNGPIMPVSDILATHATVGVLLNAVTGIAAKVVVGFGNSARLKSVLAGDADFYTAAADQELKPLFESGDVQALYTIVGEQFPPEVDRSRTPRILSRAGCAAGRGRLHQVGKRHGPRLLRATGRERRRRRCVARCRKAASIAVTSERLAATQNPSPGRTP